MFLIFLYLTIFIGFIYGLFKLLLYISNTFLLIDEYFVSKISKIEDETILNYLGINAENNLNDNEVQTKPEQLTQVKVQSQVDMEDNKNSQQLNEINNKNLNKYLRLDFIISLFLGIIWFIFPLLVINLKDNKGSKSIGKYLGLFTLLSGYISLLSIKKNDPIYKQKVFITKILCSIIVLLSFLTIISYTKKIEIYNIISISLTCIWFTSNYLGLMETFNFNKSI